MDCRRTALFAAALLLGLGAIGCTPLEQRLLSSDEDERRSALGKLLGMSEEEKAKLVPKLLPALGLKADVLPEHQAQLKSDLKKVKTQEDLSATFANLGADLARASRLRAYALEALVLIGEGAVPAMGEVVANAEELRFVRTDVAKALASMGEKASAAKEPLRQAVSDEDESVALYAAVALVALGESDAEVVAALEAGTRFADDSPRRDARRALKKLGRDPDAAAAAEP